MLQRTGAVGADPDSHVPRFTTRAEDHLAAQGCDSAACARALAAAGVPLLLTHGLADVTVDPRASHAIFDLSPGPLKAALWLRGADHHCRARLDTLLAFLCGTIPALLRSPPCAHAPPSGGRDGAAPAAAPAATTLGPIEWGEIRIV